MTDLIETGIAERVQTVTINRPGKKNALTSAMYLGLRDAILAADADPDIRCTVITGAGDIFTAGNDMQDFLAMPPVDDVPPAYKLLYALLEAQKPVIVAVNGLAVGIGMTMLLHCDLVIADEGAGFKAPFVDLALVPEGGSSQLFVDMMGRSVAADVFLTGRTLSAAEALDYGLIARIVPNGTALDAARAAARDIAAKAPPAVLATKELMVGPRRKTWRAHMDRELEIFTARLKSPEIGEVVAAFMEKRAPNFG